MRTWSEKRRQNAEFYNRAFAASLVQTPFISSDCASIFNQYVIRVAHRDEILAVLKQEGIGTEVYYPVPMHRQECFAGKCQISGKLIEAEEASRSVLALPIYPELTQEQLDYVAQVVLQSTSPSAQATLCEATR